MKKLLLVLLAFALMFVVPGSFHAVCAQDDDATLDADSGSDAGDEGGAEPAESPVYVCPDCGYEASEAGTCPTCNVALTLKSAATEEPATEEPATEEPATEEPADEGEPDAGEE